MYYFSLNYKELNPLDHVLITDITKTVYFKKTIYIELLLWMLQAFQQDNPVLPKGNLQQKNFEKIVFSVYVNMY